ncbi:MAG: hypothetical protein C5S49_00980 [Candidatus Methanogaster sp.]|nr:MAG: hypothetical protein C5S49_00980 [ANME-2 cluster archaeon]
MEEDEVLRIIEEAAESKQPGLDLSGNQLTALPPEIAKLASLTELDLSGNQLTALLPEITKLTSLTELYLSNNQLTALPPEIAKLTKLTGIYLSGNQLTALPPEIAKLTNLTVLNLSFNQLTALPPEIVKLVSLTELDLSGNQLTALLPEIAKLTNLTELYLSGNQLTALLPEITKLTKIIRLDLSNNQLTALPPEITKLASLTVLNLSNNQLTALPSEITKLTKLIRLDLSNNQLTALPPEITKLTKLTGIYLSDNQLTALPPEITKLVSLTGLDLSSNQLTALPHEIVELGLEIKWERGLIFDGVNLRGNPLETPPVEIVKKGRDAVIDYFKSLEGEKRALNEVKVLLVGDGGAGKTSLVKQLLGEEFDEKESQTHGINIKKWKVEEGDNEITVNFWDFGGQEIMHATHQFFLSKRSLYILVLDGRKEEKAEYWLKHIESFGGDSPVVVVLNKMDENPGFDLNRKFLQDKYPPIKGFYRISCKQHAGINDFCENLKKALTKIEHLQTTWAINWFDVKTQLEKMTDNFISYETYKEMCNENNITERSAQDTLVDYLNDLGVILHFKDFSLLDTHVLEPKWVTEAVYKIINSEKMAESKGILKLDLLDEILKREKETDYHYPRDRYQYIIDLMMKFELCYELDRETVLLPGLLEVQEPEFDFDYANSLKFSIEYDFFPRSVMPRFIVRKNKEIKDKLQWRTGVVLEDTAFKSIAVVKSDDDAKKIYIHVDGVQKRDYFSAILSTLREINRSFEKLKFVEKVPMPDDPEITVSYEHLIRLERRGTREYLPDGSEKEYNVKDLLGTIYSENKTEEEILQILRELKEKSDTEETLLKKAKDSVILQPNFMGFGIDVKKLIGIVFRPLSN